MNRGLPEIKSPVRAYQPGTIPSRSLVPDARGQAPVPKLSHSIAKVV
jgi:hypothetical protein